MLIPVTKHMLTAFHLEDSMTTLDNENNMSYFDFGNGSYFHLRNATPVEGM